MPLLRKCTVARAAAFTASCDFKKQSWADLTEQSNNNESEYAEAAAIFAAANSTTTAAITVTKRWRNGNSKVVTRIAAEAEADAALVFTAEVEAARVAAVTTRWRNNKSKNAADTPDATVPPPPAPYTSPRPTSATASVQHRLFTPLDAYPEYAAGLMCGFKNCRTDAEHGICTEPPIGWWRRSKKNEGICKSQVIQKLEDEKAEEQWVPPPKVCVWVEKGYCCEKGYSPDTYTKTGNGNWMCPPCRAYLNTPAPSPAPHTLGDYIP